jgi:hypothetical protein
MNGEATKLDNKDIYLLGVLAECNHGGTAKFPRGCSVVQAQALIQAGYLMERPERLADGRRATLYEITPKGLNAWNSYRFVDSTVG